MAVTPGEGAGSTHAPRHPARDTQAHSGEQPRGAAGLGAGPAARAVPAPGAPCVAGWDQRHFQSRVWGRCPRVSSPLGACRPPHADASGERPARTSPGGRGHSLQRWARAGLGEPAPLSDYTVRRGSPWKPLTRVLRQMNIYSISGMVPGKPGFPPRLMWGVLGKRGAGLTDPARPYLVLKPPCETVTATRTPDVWKTRRLRTSQCPPTQEPVTALVGPAARPQPELAGGRETPATSRTRLSQLPGWF